MKFSRPALGPHHLGEELVCRLLGSIRGRLARVRAYELSRPTTRLELADLIDLSARVQSLEANAVVTNVASGGRSPQVDGMHRIDCAIKLPTATIAVEVKLGATRLSPGEFRRQFVEKGPKLTHRGTRLGGNMVSFLDRNGRARLRPPIELQCAENPVEPGWLVVTRESTREAWALASSGLRGGLASLLGVKQLKGIVTLEEIVSAVGLEASQEISLDLARESIEGWDLWASTR